jgi:D-hexose-6-phosphate mutarotase
MLVWKCNEKKSVLKKNSMTNMKIEKTDAVDVSLFSSGTQKTKKLFEISLHTYFVTTIRSVLNFNGSYCTA